MVLTCIMTAGKEGEKMGTFGKEREASNGAQQFPGEGKRSPHEEKGQGESISAMGS